MSETVPQQSGGTAGRAADANGGAPWGFWGTAGFAALTLVLFYLTQGLVAVGFLIHEPPDIDPEQLATYLEGNGLFISIAVCVAGVVCTLTVLLLARLRRGISVREYLALRMPAGRSLLLWLGIAVAVVVAIDAILMLAGRDTVPEFMIKGYRSAVYLPLFWFTLVIAAPVSEEFLFRGFLFRGWMDSRLRATGTILLTSAIWCLIHIQYGFVELLVVFAYGIVLGFSRYRTGSLVTPLVIHGVINLGATLQVALLA